MEGGAKGGEHVLLHMLPVNVSKENSLQIFPLLANSSAVVSLALHDVATGTVSFEEEVYAYTFIKFLTEFGGLLGLILGLSTYTCLEKIVRGVDLAKRRMQKGN